MSVLVVGGSGLVGAAVAAELLERGHTVIAGSRGGDAPVGETIKLDVRRVGLGLDAAELQRVQSSVTHIVASFGSVDWDETPQSAMSTHAQGTKNLLDLAATCRRLERFVAVSSVLVLGRAEGRLTNRELQVGQRFRTWYEYGKFLAESAVRAEQRLPWRVVRLGPVLGADGPVGPDPRSGLISAVPTLLRGYPAAVEDCGRFPCYVSEVGASARVIATACETAGSRETWTYYDPATPSLAGVLTALCAPWGVMPRLIDAPRIIGVARLLAPRLAMPEALLVYGRRWTELDPGILDDLPELPAGASGYIEQTGAWLRKNSVAELAA